MSEASGTATIAIDTISLENNNKKISWEERAAEIEAKGRELRMKEEQLRKREEQLRNTNINQQNIMNPRIPNWPPFYPIIKHAINEEIPSGQPQFIVQHSYLLWKGTALYYAINSAIIGLSMLFGGSMFSFIFSLLYFAIFPAMAFFCWHYSLYHAMRTESSTFLLIYLVVFAAQILVFGLLAIGLFGEGGIFGVLGLLAIGRIAASIIAAIMTAGIVCLGILCAVQLKRAFGWWHEAGHSINKALRKEATNVAIKQLQTESNI